MNTGIWIIGLLILIQFCLIVLFILIFLQNHKKDELTYQMGLQNQEALSRSNSNEEKFQQTFKNIQNQIQDMKSQQVLSNQNMETIGESLLNINRIMTNTKMRGNWGEYQLDLLLSAYVGENPHIYQTQYTLKNGKIADAVLFIAQDHKVLCVDSKFPMENYLKMDRDVENRSVYFKQFRGNMKKHIDDISKKYITEETVNFAVMFIPSESIYQFVCAKCDDIFAYALQRHVQMVSPSTLAGVVFTLLDSTKEFYRSQHIDQIEKNVLMLKDDVDRLLERSMKAEKGLETLANQFHLVSTSASKIHNRMEKMMNAKDEEE